MIIDARSLPANHQLKCDLCIVGAGAAGISLALELADSPYTICLLEAGGESHEADTQSLLKGDVIGAAYPELQRTRLASLGGSTSLWAGWCRPLDPIDFEKRDWVAESGWPFGIDVLAPFYERAHRLCGLGPFDYDADAWEKRIGAARLPLAPEDFSTSMFHISPVHFGSRYRTALARSAAIQTVLHAIVLRLFTSDDGNRIERVRAGTLNGKGFDVVARTFVLAAGGIENARLLLLSGESPERSVGNSRGLVGRFFMEHGFINAGSYVTLDRSRSLAFHFPNRVRWQGHDCTIRGGLSVNASTMQHERMLNAAAFFHPAYESHEVFDSPEVRAMLELREQLRGRAVPGGYLKRLGAALRSPGKLAIAAYRKLAVRPGPQQRWRTRALFECEPNRDNRVSLCSERDALGRPQSRVEWRLGEKDLRSIRRTHQLLDQALRRAGLGYFESRLHDDSAWLAAVEGGKHHMGTTRMSAEPSRGVVDADCKVHEVENLYISGSSVFPTGGFANPTLTIVALAARLASHLRSQYREPASVASVTMLAPVPTPLDAPLEPTP
jgi:choline dehydrogenase-like flavoprotein